MARAKLAVVPPVEEREEEVQYTPHLAAIVKAYRTAQKFPKELGPCLDLCYALRAERLHVQRLVKKLYAEQEELEDHILRSFDKVKLNSGRGAVCTASVTKNVFPHVVDWDAFYKYILKNKAIEMLERRPAKSACRERWDDGKSIPGVEKSEVVGLSLVKAGKK